MQVETINDTTKRFNGYNYQKKSNGYYNRASGDTSYHLHREVWRHHNGEIPEGYHIHHKDGNKENNSPENLQAVSSKEHAQIHLTEERRKEMAKNVVENATPEAAKWHGSKEGREWHSQHGKKTWEKRETITKECRHCHKEYETYFPSRSKYCHQNCKMKARRRRLKGLPEELDKIPTT